MEDGLLYMEQNFQKYINAKILHHMRFIQFVHILSGRKKQRQLQYMNKLARNFGFLACHENYTIFRTKVFDYENRRKRVY